MPEVTEAVSNKCGIGNPVSQVQHLGWVLLQDDGLANPESRMVGAGHTAFCPPPCSEDLPKKHPVIS